jgi:hypothetical protein
MSRTASPWLPRLCNLIIPLLILLPVLWALLPGGLPNTADGTVHFVRATEMVAAWQDGIFLPRWSLNLGFGYGIPLFVYAPPLPYLLTAAYHSLGFAPEAAFKTMLVSALLIGATGAYRLGHLFFGLWAGAVAAAAFIYAPIQLRELFVQGNVAQFLAWSFLPWAFWATIQIYRSHQPTRQLGYALVMAVALMGTLLSHNVVALMLLQSVAALGIILWIATHHHRAFWITVGGGTLGLLLSAWFSVPALLEGSYVALDMIVASDYRLRFITLPELLAWPPRLDTGAINPYIPLTLGLPHVLIGLLGILLLAGWALSRRISNSEQSNECPSFSRLFWGTATFMVLFTLFCGLMATRVSMPIWALMPFADLFEFPARWHGFTMVGLAWLAAALVGMIGVGVIRRRMQPIVASGLLLLLMGAALVGLYPHKIAPGSRVMSPYEVVRYEVKSGAVGTTSLGEFNPVWVTRPLNTSPLVEDYLERRPVDRLAGMLPPNANHSVLEVNAHRQRYNITLAAPATLTFNLHYFPGWRAKVNQMPVPVRPQATTGLLTVDLPAGESTLELTFGPTLLRRVMGIISGVIWIGVLLGLVIVQMRRPLATSEQTFAPVDRQTGAASTRGIVVGTATIGAVACAVWVLQWMGADWFQLHSQPDQALPARVQQRADIGDRFRLLGLDPLPTTIQAGDSLNVVAYWRALDEMDENYALVLRLEDVATNQVLAAVEQSHPSDIPTSGWATGLYLRNAIQMAIPVDTPPIQYAVRAGFRDHATGEMLATEQGTTVELGRLWVLPVHKPAPPAGPRATFDQTIELLGAEMKNAQLTLYWRADAPVASDYSIFVHLLDEQGQLLGQLDGTPYANRYPLWAWQPGQIIQDQRDLAAAQVDLAQLHSVAVGIYDPATGQRLAAVDAEGNLLPDNAQIIPLPHAP